MTWGLKTNVTAVLIVGILGLVIFVGNIPLDIYGGYSGNGSNDLNTFTSFKDIRDYLNEKSNDRYSEDYPSIRIVPFSNTKDIINLEQVAFEEAPTSSAGSSSDYSTTNIQVEGVDEGDIVKNDGKYAYIVSRNHTKVYILDVYPPEDAKILAQIELNWTVKEIYLNENKLVIVGENYAYYLYYNGYRSRSTRKTLVWVYDITDRSNPVLSRSEQLEGSSISSRMIGDYFYIIVNQPSGNIEKEEDLPAPPYRIHYINDTDDTNFYFTNFASFNIKYDSQDLENMIILLGSSNHIYVSTKNIYIVCLSNSRKHVYSKTGDNSYYEIELTTVFRVSINKGEIRYETSGTVPGRALNRFSMDEHNKYFRIATTTGHISRYDEGTAMNNVYVLNMDMIIVGELTDIAPGERIYSARFMGERCYLVTFKKVDPFFVIDLSSPRFPKVLGELKIPGYSNYLHPYDENHVIGIGKDTVEAGEGNFAWYQGVKMSLFDVTDVRNPKELSKFIIGDRGTDSDALNDPHAFLFSKEKNLLVIPIRLAEINESKYPDGASANTHGEYTWCGAYVFDISTNQGIKLRGRISHLDGTEETDSSWNYYSRYYNKGIKRSFYMDDILYTISDNLIKSNKLTDLSEISAVELAS